MNSCVKQVGRIVKNNIIIIIQMCIMHSVLSLECCLFVNVTEKNNRHAKSVLIMLTFVIKTN